MEQKIFQDSMKNDIHVYIYRAKTDTVKGIIHLIHGASEHLLRYGVFAEFMNNHGYTCTGADFLGHGLSTKTNDYVHYHDRKGHELALESLVIVKDYINETYPEIPVYLLGHSMGAFLGELMIFKYPQFYNKAVISGTTMPDPISLAAGKTLCKLIGFFRGPKYVSPLIQSIAIDSCPAKMKKDGLISERNVEWITHDVNIQNYYESSPMCGQPFTVSANKDLFTWMQFISKTKNIKKGHLDQPILFISGKQDPLSNYGENVIALVEKLKKIGYRRVQMKLYDGYRHEVLNEIDNQKVFDEVLNFIES